MMVCAGASEQAVSQWASAFAEKGLGSGGPILVGMVSGALGDNLKMGILAGIIIPVLLLMGIILCRKTKGEFS